MKETQYYVYIVRCRDNSLYTGYTTDVEKRVDTHNRGEGAKYTRSRLPVQLAGYWRCSDKSHALRTEAALKRLSHHGKEKLLQSVPVGSQLETIPR